MFELQSVTVLNPGTDQLRITEQVLHWKNFNQKGFKDNYESRYPATGNKPHKRGEFTDQVLDIIGGKKSQALHGICRVSTKYSGGV